MTDKQFDTRAVVKEELKGAKTLADVEAAANRAAVRAGRRLPTAIEVFSGALLILEVAGIDKDGQAAMAELLGQSVRAVMDKADKEAAAKSEFTEAGPTDSTWEVWPNSSSYSN